jgi:hypothetical protein
MKRYKRGDVREDGMVFCNYTGRGTAWWVTPEKLAEMRKQNSKDMVKWRGDNKEVVSERNKQWRDANPDKARDNLRKWRKENRERDLEITRNWRKKNPDKVKLMYENKKKDIQKFRLDSRIRRAKRRSLLIERLHPEHDAKIERLLVLQCQSLFNRLGIKFEVDHIIPITKGGWHHHTNLHVIPMTLNRRKHNKDNSSLPNCWNLQERCRLLLT